MLKASGAAKQVQSTFQTLPGIAAQTAAAFANIVNAANAQAGKAPILVVPVTPHAADGIFTRPHINLIAERGPEAIIPLSGATGGAITVNAPITINGASAEHGDLTAILTEHARTIAREVQRIMAIEYEQAAVV